MSAAPKPKIPDSAREGVFRFLKDFREGYDATSFGIYYSGFDVRLDANCIEAAGHVAEIRFKRDRTGRIDAFELIRLSPKAPTPALVQDDPDDEIVHWNDGTTARYGDLMAQDRKTVERDKDGILRGGYEL